MTQKQDTQGNGDVPFGYRTVKSEDKAGMVRDVFDSVAPKYDLMNDLMSLGVHRLWKREMVAAVKPRPMDQILDVAGGTGDIGFALADRLASDAPPVTICDINAEMLSVGRDRAFDDARMEGVRWVCGNAEALPLPSRMFDVYTIAFGIRNVTDLDAALSEAYRVLGPGGRFVCLEFSKVVLPVLDKIYDTYSFSVLPWLGSQVAGDKDSYQYLAESIRTFPDQQAFKARIESAGFKQASVRNLSGGIAALHMAWRI